MCFLKLISTDFSDKSSPTKENIIFKEPIRMRYFSKSHRIDAIRSIVINDLNNNDIKTLANNHRAIQIKVTKRGKHFFVISITHIPDNDEKESKFYAYYSWQKLINSKRVQHLLKYGGAKIINT